MIDYRDLTSQLTRIEDKLARLRRSDRRLKLFGASAHGYRLNPKLRDGTIAEFEGKHRIHLPHDYRCFIRFLGNGGVGPYYGLGTLEDGIFADMDSRKKNYLLDLSSPFPYSEPWNIDISIFENTPEENISELEERYFDTSHAAGLLRLCNYGCGVSINLVVKGAEYGIMWTDDRVNNLGIFPSYELGNKDKLVFIDWYELWLDNSLATF